MFIPVSFHSVNSPDDLAPGRYSAVGLFYASNSDPLRAVLVEYTLTPSEEPLACDLLVIEADGSVRARDFVWLNDRSWRDSDGLRANRLSALLPAELLPLQFVRSEVWDSIDVGGGQ